MLWITNPACFETMGDSFGAEAIMLWIINVACFETMGGDFGIGAIMLWITDAAYFETMVSFDVVNNISKLVSLGGKETNVRALLSFPIEISTLFFSLQPSYLGLKIMHGWPSELWEIMSLKILGTIVLLLFASFSTKK
ncbi:hypothetical protein V6N13_072012 [Hibiscus sabdariffa]